MTHEEHQWYSPQLGQDMTLRVYGHSGKPIIVFPCQGGRYFEYQDFGMTEVLRPWLDTGKIQLFAVDSVDNQSWCNQSIHPYDRAQRHEAYDRYIMQEVIPFIKGYSTEKICTTGCSMGGYHTANFFFKHPDVFDSMISISGIFRLNMFIGDYSDETVYFNTPLAYLSNMNDEKYLNQYRDSKIFICVGQGAWEDEMLEDTYSMMNILHDKSIPAVIDIWGHDVNHDWEWWRKMVPHMMGQLIPVAV